MPRSGRVDPPELRGRLLVATPPLVDPNFDRSVVLMLEHGEEGALGIMLNRPTEATLATVLPEWQAHASAPGVIFSGGPVAPEAVIALARGGADSDAGWVSVLDDGRQASTSDAIPAISGSASTRCASSSATRAGGRASSRARSRQTPGSWYRPGRPIPSPSGRSDLWRDVLRRQPGRVAMFAQLSAGSDDELIADRCNFWVVRPSSKRTRSRYGRRCDRAGGDTRHSRARLAAVPRPASRRLTTRVAGPRDADKMIG